MWRDGKLSGYSFNDALGNSLQSVKILFDNTGESIGFIYSDIEEKTQETFFFGKNIFGDIVTVYDSMGSALVTYNYDAWGNITPEAHGSSLQSALKAIVALAVTPITYRGYNYDLYTGLYYLQSRYYNPVYGRFLNADAIFKTGDIHGANLFAYCNNNPVKNVDYSGLTASESFNKTVFTNIILSIVAFFCLEKELQKLNLGYVLRDCVLTDVLIVSDNILTFFITLQRTNIEGITEKYQVYYSIGTVFQWLTYINMLQGVIISSPSGSIVDSIFKVIDLFKGNPAIATFGDVVGVVISNFSDNTIEYIEFLKNSMDMSDPYATYFVLEYIFVTTSSYGKTHSLLDEPILRKVG